MHRVTLGSLLFVCLLGAARSQVNVNIPGIVDVAVGGSDVAVDVFGKRVATANTTSNGTVAVEAPYTNVSTSGNRTSVTAPYTSVNATGNATSATAPYTNVSVGYNGASAEKSAAGRKLFTFERL